MVRRKSGLLQLFDKIITGRGVVSAHFAYPVLDDMRNARDNARQDKEYTVDGDREMTVGDGTFRVRPPRMVGRNVVIASGGVVTERADGRRGLTRWDEQLQEIQGRARRSGSGQ